MKILHIDDSSGISGLYNDVFSDENHTIQSVNSGKEGLDLVFENDFDLILLDMCMLSYREMDFLRDLKNQQPKDLRKVVVLNAQKFSTTYIKELLKMGIHSVEEKPIELQKLVV